MPISPINNVTSGPEPSQPASAIGKDLAAVGKDVSTRGNGLEAGINRGVARPDGGDGLGKADIGQKTTDGPSFALATLSVGSTGRQVLLLQQALIVLGYEGTKADGIFGPKTGEATQAFQAARGLVGDGVVGNRQTWPALSQALVTRHEGLTRLADAMGPGQPAGGELKQINAVMAQFSDRASMPPSDMAQQPVPARASGAEVTYTVRGGETLGDVARLFGLPVSALIASNPDLAKPYLILQGQLLTIPNPVKDRTFRRPPRQLHPADPQGFLASPNMNPDFVDRVNGMVEQLRGEGFDVRVIAGFRSFTEQQQRYEQGRQASGTIVTDFEAGRSWHNYGLAADIALNDDDGSPAWPEDSSPFWQRLGDVALVHGANWGGLRGYPSHVEYHPGYGADEAGSFIEDFESYGLKSVWERIALVLPPDV